MELSFLAILLTYVAKLNQAKPFLRLNESILNEDKK